jgi:hypothetical protein
MHTPEKDRCREEKEGAAQSKGGRGAERETNESTEGANVISKNRRHKERRVRRSVRGREAESQEPFLFFGGESGALIFSRITF